MWKNDINDYGSMRIKATFTAIGIGLPFMALMDYLEAGMQEEWMRIGLEITLLLVGALIILCAAEITKCGVYCGLAAAIYIILMVSHIDSSMYLYSVMRAFQTIIGVSIAWFINVKLLPYPPKPGTLSYYLLKNEEKRKLSAKETKAVFFDVDGTLLSHQSKSVPESTKSAVSKLKEKGIKCVAATGRHKLELEELPLNDLDFDGYITLNGQICYDERGKILYDHPISGKDKETLIRLFHEKEIPIVLIEKDQMYINYIDYHVIKAQEDISTKIPDIGRYSGNEIYMAVAYVPREKEEELKEEIPSLRITRWNENGVDIISSHGGKAVGIERYLKKTGIDPADSMAFGDGENDMKMLQFVHIGVAMGNSDESVKQYANHVTSSVDEDGIEKALLFYGLIS